MNQNELNEQVSSYFCSNSNFHLCESALLRCNKKKLFTLKLLNFYCFILWSGEYHISITVLRFLISESPHSETG